MACYFCKLNVREIDFKNSGLLGKFMSDMAKIKRKRASRLCSKHQRHVAKAIKRARYLGLLPYTLK